MQSLGGLVVKQRLNLENDGLISAVVKFKLLRGAWSSSPDVAGEFH